MTKAELGAATHMFVLVRTFQQSEGDVLELGTGYFSTLLLHWMCVMTGRKLVSYDTQLQWYEKALKEYGKVEDCPEYSGDDVDRVENFHRNAISRGLDGVAVLGDKILVSDLDEIPRPSSITENLSYPNWIYLQHDLFCYYVNCRLARTCNGTVMAAYGTFKDPQQLRRFCIRRNRYSGGTIENIIVHAGWHYTYMTGGDPKRIRTKVENIFHAKEFAHLLGTDAEIKAKMLNHHILFRDTPQWQQTIVDISQTKPKSMDKFLEKYPRFFFKETI